MKTIKDFNLVVIDVETGGQDADEHSILEVAMLALDDKLELIGSMERTICEPVFHVEPGALQINNIDLGYVTAYGIRPYEVATYIFDFLSCSYPDSDDRQIMLVGWRTPFDRSFLMRLFRLARYTEKDFNAVFSHRVLDLASVSTFHFAPVNSTDAFASLDALPEPGVRHTAMGDCMATWKVFKELRRRTAL